MLILGEFKQLTWSFIRLISGETTSTFKYNVLLTSWIHTRIHNGQSLKYNLQTFKLRLKIHKNIALRFKNKSEGFLLMLIDAIKPKNFTHFPELILCNFSTRVCESSTHDLCVLPLQICKLKCNWFSSADIMEIILVARVRRRYFRRRQATAGNTSAFAGYRSSCYCFMARGHCFCCLFYCVVVHEMPNLTQREKDKMMISFTWII